MFSIQQNLAVLFLWCFMWIGSVSLVMYVCNCLSLHACDIYKDPILHRNSTWAWKCSRRGGAHGYCTISGLCVCVLGFHTMKTVETETQHAFNFFFNVCFFIKLSSDEKELSSLAFLLNKHLERDIRSLNM